MLLVIFHLGDYPAISSHFIVCWSAFSHELQQVRLQSDDEFGEQSVIFLLVQPCGKPTVYRHQRSIIIMKKSQLCYCFQLKMINVDFAGLSEYRSDGRKRDQLRATKVELGIDAHADGSCILKQGLTEVLCLVNGPYQRPSNSEFLLKIEYTVAPFSSLQKRRGKHDREFSQFAQNIRKSFQGVIVADLYRKHQIQITVSVLQNEGSAKSAVLNCISLALADAGVCMRDLLVSCTVGSLMGHPLVDTNEEEEYQLANECVVSYLQGAGTVDCVELRKAKVKEEGVTQIQRLAVKSCQIIYQLFRNALLEYSIKKMLIF